MEGCSGCRSECWASEVGGMEQTRRPRTWLPVGEAGDKCQRIGIPRTQRTEEGAGKEQQSFRYVEFFYIFTFTYDFAQFGKYDKKCFVLWENSIVAKHTELGWVQSPALPLFPWGLLISLSDIMKFRLLTSKMGTISTSFRELGINSSIGKVE